MKYARDIHAILFRAIKDDVSSRFNASITSADYIAPAPQRRHASYLFEAFDQQVQIPVRLT
jgi:hypothetical protein